MRVIRRVRTSRIAIAIVGSAMAVCGMTGYRLLAQSSGTLGAPFERQILAPALPESPFDLRFFSTAVKTGADGRIVRDVNAPGPSRLVEPFVPAGFDTMPPPIPWACLTRSHGHPELTGGWAS